MNFCRRCDSEYSEPGTCNCFAETPIFRTMPLPYCPSPYIYPVYPHYPPWYGTVTSDPMPNGDTITITNMDCGAVTRSGGGPVSGNWTTVEQANKFGASTPTVQPLVTSENFGTLLLEAARQCVEYDRQH